MTSKIFTDLTTLLKGIKDLNGNTVFKTVELWNSQPLHWEREENDDKPRLLPACFVEFTNIEPNGQNTRKVLHKNFKTVLHIIYTSLKDNDPKILDTKETVYQQVQWFESDNCSKFLWNGEEIDTDFGNLRYYKQTYAAMRKDFGASNIPIPNSVGNMTTNTIILPTL